MTQIDWRLPEHRREAFQRSYTFSLKYGTFPGCVYPLLPAIVDAFDMEDDDDQKAWLVWLNGNTQNVVTSLMLLEAAPRPQDWRKAVDFWNEHFKLLEWDTDRRHQKSKFGEATEGWIYGLQGESPGQRWRVASYGWRGVWDYAYSLPHMGRLSSWSMIEYARIVFGPSIPDAATLMLNDKAGSRSHRNGLALIAGYDSVYWEADIAEMLGIVPELEELGESLLAEAVERNRVPYPEVGWVGSIPHSDVSRLTLESALCTYKSWHKPNRRYPNVYADMMYNRIKKAEARFDRTFDLLWDARQKHLPGWFRLEDCPYDPGLSVPKQNWYRETGEIPVLCSLFEDMDLSGYDHKVVCCDYGLRKDPKWM